MSNHTKKTPSPSRKVTFLEVAQAFQAVTIDIRKLQMGMSWLADLLIEKNAFTAEELKAFFDKNIAVLESTIPPAAAGIAPSQEAPCAPSPETSVRPSSTPITA